MIQYEMIIHDYHWLPLITIQEQAVLHQSSAIFQPATHRGDATRSGTSSLAIWHGARRPRRPRRPRQARQAQRRPGQLVNGKNNTSDYSGKALLISTCLGLMNLWMLLLYAVEPFFFVCVSILAPS